MDALNTIEKITLLVSTSIVCLANLFVLIERTKKSEKHAFHTIIQKLLGLKNTFFVFALIFVMSSCSSGKFLNRKYTMGRFTENVKSLKHNTIYVDTTKSYAYVSDPMELKKSSISLNNIPDKEIINNKVESIIKKDSIFIFKKRGRNKVTVVKNSLPNVTVIVQGDKRTVKQAKKIDFDYEKTRRKARAKKLYKYSLILSFIPFVGFIIAITAKKSIKKYQTEFPDENEKFNKSRINFAIIFSLFSSLIGLVALLYGFFLLFLANTMTAIY